MSTFKKGFEPSINFYKCAEIGKGVIKLIYVCVLKLWYIIIFCMDIRMFYTWSWYSKIAIMELIVYCIDHNQIELFKCKRHKQEMSSLRMLLQLVMDLSLGCTHSSLSKFRGLIILSWNTSLLISNMGVHMTKNIKVPGVLLFFGNPAVIIK